MNAIRVLSVLAIVALGAVACGSDDTNSNSNDKPTSGNYLAACSKYCEGKAAGNCDNGLSVSECKDNCASEASAEGDCGLAFAALGKCYERITDACATDNCAAESTAASGACE
jgi:hypothetical protein